MDIFNTDDPNDVPTDDASSTVSFSVGVDYILDRSFTFVDRDTQESIPLLLNNNENEFTGKYIRGYLFFSICKISKV